MTVFQWFFRQLSDLPGRCRAIAAHLLPHLLCSCAMIASSCNCQLPCSRQEHISTDWLVKKGGQHYEVHVSHQPTMNCTSTSRDRLAHDPLENTHLYVCKFGITLPLSLACTKSSKPIVQAPATNSLDSLVLSRLAVLLCLPHTPVLTFLSFDV